MTENKKGSADLDDLDWDAAIAEWEQKALPALPSEPGPSRPAGPGAPAAPAAGGAAPDTGSAAPAPDRTSAVPGSSGAPTSRTPSSVVPPGAVPRPAPRASSAPSRPAAAAPAGPTAPPPAADRELPSLMEDDTDQGTGATRVADPPPGPPRPSASGRSRGGLGQLFASPAVPPAPPSPARPPPDNADRDFFEALFDQGEGAHSSGPTRVAQVAEPEAITAETDAVRLRRLAARGSDPDVTITDPGAGGLGGLPSLDRRDDDDDSEEEVTQRVEAKKARLHPRPEATRPGEPPAPVPPAAPSSTAARRRTAPPPLPPSSGALPGAPPAPGSGGGPAAPEAPGSWPRLEAGAALHAPAERAHDPDSETGVLSGARAAEMRATVQRMMARERQAGGGPDAPPAVPSDVPSERSAVPATGTSPSGSPLGPSRRPRTEDEPTRMRARADLAPRTPRSERRREAAGAIGSSPPDEPRSWSDERPASAWLDDDAAAVWDARASWLEEEARAHEDPVARARGLLAASEVLVIAGDSARAAALAIEARELAPQLALAHKQARALGERDPARVTAALEAEATHAPTPAARVHAMLVAADVMRLSGSDDAGAARWDEAARAVPSDLRAPLGLAARALAAEDHASPVLRLGDAPALIPIATAVGTALRLRGIERGDAETLDAGATGEASVRYWRALPNDSLRRARLALADGDRVAASRHVADLRAVPELARGAIWLSAALAAPQPTTRGEAAQALRQLLGSEDEREVRRALAARAVELGDAALLTSALSGVEPAFTPAERSVLGALLDLGPDYAPELDAIASDPAETPLAAALAASTLPGQASGASDPGQASGASDPGQASGASDPDLWDRVARAGRVAGNDVSCALARLGRLLAAEAPEDVLEASVDAVARERADTMRALSLELAVRAGRWEDVCRALARWSDAEETASTRDAFGARDRHLAAAVVAEAAGHPERALEGFRAALLADRSAEAAMRALLELDPNADRVAEVLALADATEGERAAFLRLEALMAAPEGGDGVLSPTDPQLLAQAERIDKATPTLPFGSFVAERIARRMGDVEAVLRWIRDRRTRSEDALEGALDAVREALLVADKDPITASERLAEAHRARPDDVALRELYERLAAEPPEDRGTWREARAKKSQGPSRALLFMEAAYEFERAGDKEGCLRAARAAREAGDDGLGRLAQERAEIEGGTAARLADELLALARSTEVPRERREAYERLADLDAVGRGDASSALLWHRAILEDEPGHKPSLRWVEHALLSAGRDEELEPVASAVALALSDIPDPECAAHAQLAARLRIRLGQEWEATRDLADIGAAQADPLLWALHLTYTLARARRHDAAIRDAALALLARITRPMEIAALALRAAEASGRLDQPEKARELLERATAEDPGDVVAWGQLVEMRQRLGDRRGAAEASESLARTSAVAEHQLLAWSEAGRLWLALGDGDRAVAAFEAAAAVDIGYGDVYQQLYGLYTERGDGEELAGLLERRIAKVHDPAERVSLEVDRGRALAEMGDLDGARKALEAALGVEPDHTAALAAMGDVCARREDWTGAEQAWVRLARLLTTPEEQREIYERLGELYAVHAVNLARAEVALREVLKRAPDDVPTLERLVEVHCRQNDAGRAVETQNQLLALAKDPQARKTRLVRLARIHDEVGHEARKAEQVLDGARREFPQDVTVLRTIAEFYQRHRQMPAVNILLDRAATDARRALAAGRFTAGHFEMLATVYDLRGRKDAARVVAATLEAFRGRPASLRGAEARACDPRLDDLLAPELLTPALRALLARTGDALDVASPLDLRALAAQPLPANATTFRNLVVGMAQAMGIPNIQIYLSPHLGRTCVPTTSTPPAIVAGEALVSAPSDGARTFLVVRALKLVQARASALVRTPAADLAVLTAAWLRAFNPTWVPQGVSPQALADAGRRLQPGLPRQLDPDVGVVALEVIGTLGTQGATLGAHAITWANRVALVAVGDPNAALEGIAWSMGAKDGPPAGADERAEWVARTLEIKDLIGFSVTDAYAETRARLGLEKP